MNRLAKLLALVAFVAVMAGCGGATSDPRSAPQATTGVSALATLGCACTYTPGFWKTHPEIWADLAVPQDPDAQFFGSGQSWLEVLLTPPKNGDIYYIFAHQWIAAFLSWKNEITIDALPGLPFILGPEGGPAYFEANSPGSGVVNGNCDRACLIEWVEVLDAFNNGLYGVPHCGD